MSFQATEWARSLPLDTLSAKFTLLMIASYAGTDGSCYPSLSTLAADTLQSVATVRRRIRELEQLGLLVRMARWTSPDGQVIVTSIGDGARPSECRQTSDELRLVLTVTGADVRARLQERQANGEPAGDAHGESGADAGDDDAAADEPHEAPQNGPDGAGRVSACNPPGGVSVQPSPYHPGETPGVSPGSHPLNSHPKIQGNKPPYPPQAGGAAAEPSSKEAEAAFERFAAAYPDPITDHQRALRVWLALGDSERAQALLGVKGYAAYLQAERNRSKGRARPAKNAHLWLQGRMWLGYLDAGRQAVRSGERFDATEGSEQWNAWMVFYRCCGKSAGIPEFLVRGPLGERTAHVPSEWPPVGRGLDADASHWVSVIQGSGEFAAWLRRLRELDGVSIATPTLVVDGRAVASLRVPCPWPPGKGTGPPLAPASAEELADLK